MGATVIAGRQTAAAEGDIVVFHIGMRINRLRAPRSWLPVLRAMPRMLQELAGDKDSGLLGWQLLLGGPRTFQVVQYWRSQEQLLAYASAADRRHRPAWAEFNRRARAGKRHVGVWHETYVVPAGSYEAIYADMPAYGLAAATGVVPIGRRGERAAERLRGSSV
jgi:Domain of unknown function (DUF4188)